MTNQEIKNIVKQLNLFKNLDDSALEDVLSYLDYNISPLNKGNIIIKQDTPCNHLHILLSGLLEVNIIDALGNNVKIENLKGPRAFATPHIFSGNDIFPATFTVKEEGLLLKAPKNNVFDLISKYPILLENFLKERGNCNACTVQRLRVLSYKSIRSRLSYYLMQHKTATQLAILDHNQTELADYLGVSRPALANEMKKMAEENIISISRKEVALLNLSILNSYI